MRSGINRWAATDVVRDSASRPLGFDPFSGSDCVREGARTWSDVPLRTLRTLFHTVAHRNSRRRRRRERTRAAATRPCTMDRGQFRLPESLVPMQKSVEDVVSRQQSVRDRTELVGSHTMGRIEYVIVDVYGV